MLTISHAHHQPCSPSVTINHADHQPCWPLLRSPEAPSTTPHAPWPASRRPPHTLPPAPPHAQAIEASKASSELDELSRALVVLLQANPALSPHVAAMGYLSKLFGAAAVERADLQKAASTVIRVVSDSPECVNAMRSLDVTTPMLKAMKSNVNTCTLLLPSCNLMAAAPELVEKMCASRAPDGFLIASDGCLSLLMAFDRF